MDETADVPYEGVVSWLLCRRLLPEDYHQRLKGMTAYIREALQQQPPEDAEVAAFLEEKKGAPFGYNEVEQFVRLLAKEKATDGLFSKAFGSASYRQWRRLQQTFQQQNLHLADVSRALCSAANGLVPSHQKNLQQKQRLISDCIKRQQQLQETAIAAQESYQQLCSNYGLHAEAAADPQLLQQQLQVYVQRKLPLRLERAQQLLQKPGADLLSFYRSFIAFSSGSSQKEEAPLPLLAMLSVKGNTSLEEAAAAAPGILVLQQQLRQQKQQQEAAKALEIEIQQQGDEGASEDSKQSHVDEAVCWVVEEGADDSGSSSTSTSSSNSSSSTSSKGLNESVLSNGVIRRQLLLELAELSAFLYSRILQSGGAFNGTSNRKQQQQQWQQNAFLPQELQKEQSTLLGWRESLEELRELLGGAETLQLLQLLQSDRAFNRVLRELLTARALVQKPLSAAKQQKSKQSVLEGEVAAAAAALEKQRRELQDLHRLLQDRMTAAVGRKRGTPGERSSAQHRSVPPLHSDLSEGTSKGGGPKGPLDACEGPPRVYREASSYGGSRGFAFSPSAALSMAPSVFLSSQLFCLELPLPCNSYYGEKAAFVSLGKPVEAATLDANEPL
ncbi:hypothetical protein ACSSS7_002645 [Eimeria intestinalis]